MDKISVVVRFHKSGNLDYLKLALFSLAIQQGVQVLIQLFAQDCDDNIISEIHAFMKDLPYYKKTKIVIDNNSRRIVNGHRIFRIPKKKDCRSLMLDLGLKLSPTRYMAILDYDDIVYQHCYSFLISRIKETHSAIAVGGCKKVILDVITDPTPFVVTKTPFKEKPINIIDQMLTNNVPIHSFVLDREAIKKSDRYFRTDMHALEDYEFLLRVMSQYKTDFQGMSNFVCEYRIRNDQSHTTPFHAPDLFVFPNWKKGRSIVEKLKSRLKLGFTISEIEKSVHSVI
jgi:hypothetical protein